MVYKGFWIIFIFFIGMIQFVDAGTISLTTTVSTGIVGDSLTGEVTLKNLGDTAARDVSVEYIFPEARYIEEITDKLPHNEEIRWSFNYSLSENKGTFPLMLDIMYKDANGYKFSALTVTGFSYGERTDSGLDVQLEVDDIVGDGKVKVNVLNRGNVGKDVKLRLILPTNLEGDTSEEIWLEDTAYAEFKVSKGSALDGSTYNIYVIAEYNDGLHHTSISNTQVKVSSKQSIFENRFLYLGISIVFLIVLVVLQFVQKKKIEIVASRFVWIKKYLNVFLLVIIILFLFVFLKPEFVFSDSTITGGDTGSHIVAAHYLKDYLLPNGKLTGWYPNWMAGMPMLQFYFIPPYLLAVMLSYIVGMNIAFKLVTILGILLLPLCVFWCLRLMKYPNPILGSIASLFLLFDESFSRWGGNIKSTFAGQFSHMISFALLLLLLGLFYKVYHEKKYLTWTIVVMTLVMTTHIYTTVIMVLCLGYYLIDSIIRKRYDGLIYLILCVIVGSMLSSFFLIPLFLKLGWTAPPKDILYGFPMFEEIFAPFYLAILPLSIVGAYSLGRKSLFFVYSYFAALFMAVISKFTSFLYIRFISIIYLIVLILGFYGIFYVFKRFRAKKILTVSLLFLSMFTILTVSSDISAWTKWNYEGLENKGSYDLFEQVIDTMKSTDVDGRMNVEYANYNYFGTPRVFEASPVFTGKPVIEALFVESSLTFPFHYYMQKEITKDAWWPTFPIAIPEIDVDKAARDMSLYNVKYFVSSSDKVQEMMDESENYRLDKKISNFGFYFLNDDSAYVEALSYDPVLVVTDDFKPISYDWINDWNVLYAFSEDDTGEFKLVANSENYKEIEKQSQPLDNCEVSSVMENERIEFYTQCPGRAHLIKVSYFPNWKSLNGEKIYPATPSIMMIVPKENKTVIVYGDYWADIFGRVVSYVGLFCLIAIFYFRNDKRLTKFVDFLSKYFEKVFYVVLVVLVCIFSGYLLFSNSGDGMKTIDHIDLGSFHTVSAEKHDFICNVNFCDSSRKDFVYVHKGNISFSMKTIPGEVNYVVVGATGRTSCRVNEVFVDEELIGKFKSEKSSSDNYVLEFNPTGTESNILIKHSPDKCYGFDIYDVYVKVKR